MDGYPRINVFLPYAEVFFSWLAVGLFAAAGVLVLSAGVLKIAEWIIGE